MRAFALELGSLLIMGVLLALAISAPGMEIPGTNANESSHGSIHEFPDSVLLINDSTLGPSLKKYSPFILDCWEPGCNPCHLIDPKIDEMARDLHGKVVFGKLNIKQNVKTMVKYRVFNYPTLLIFKNGSMIYRHIGNYPTSTLEDIISRKLGIL